MIDLGLRVGKEVEEEINNKETVCVARERMHRYPLIMIFLSFQLIH